MVVTSGRNRNDNNALFGQATYTLWEALDLTAGLRFEHEARRGNRDHTFSGFPVAASQSFDRDFNSLQPRVGLAYHLTPEVTVWANFTTGFQPGGFSSSSDNARFSSMVVPGDQLELEVKLKRMIRNMAMYECAARVDGKQVASADILCAEGRG